MEPKNILQVAQLAGVSRSTVSRAFNDGYVSEEVRKRIDEAVKKLGYRQNMLAKKLRTSESNFIGLIIPDISNEFFAKLAKSIESPFQSQGYGLFLCNSEEDPTIEDFYINNLLDNRVEAIILTPASKAANPRLAKSDVPIVLADRSYERMPSDRFAVVTSDNFGGGTIAATRIIDSGCRRLIVMSDVKESSSSLIARLEGFSKRIEGSSIDVAHYKVPVAIKDAERLTTMLLGERKFDTIFCSSDLIAFGAMKALLSAKVRIPGDIQVIGFDGLDLGEFLQISLSTVKQDVEGMGAAIGATVLDMIHGKSFKQHTVLPVEFLERGSSR
jgi:DNA-binding LacI/PurR family transcriptional regulator